MDLERQQLLETIREEYGRVVWSHKVHEKERENNTGLVKFYNLLNALFTSLTTFIVGISIWQKEVDAFWISLIFAFITTFFAFYRLSSRPEDNIQNHRQTAKDLWLQREKLFLLIERCNAPSSNLDMIRHDLEKIIRNLSNIYNHAPDTSSNSYKKASKALKGNQELTFSNSEIDSFLPSTLRVESDKK